MVGKARRQGGLLALADALAFSSVWVSLAAAVLVAACSQAMGIPIDARLVALGFAGTLLVYTVDRLRDLESDRLTSPRRSAFVSSRFVFLRGQALVAGLGAAAVGAVLLREPGGRQVLALLAGVAGLGFFHRRLKRWAATKSLYITLAWTAVVVLSPALLDPGARHAAAVAFIVAATISANLVLSNLRDGEALAARMGTRNARCLALAILLPPAAIALLGPETLRPLVLLPVLTGLAVAGFRSEERYGALVVDGALVAGAGAALAWTGLI